MPNSKSRKTAPERANTVIADWITGLNGLPALSPRNVARLKKLIQGAIAHADKATLARDDVRDGKPQRRAFDAAGGKPPR